MAKPNKIDASRCLAIIKAAENPAPGLKYKPDEHGTLFSGSAAALIAAGLADDGEFPGQAGRGRVSVTYRGLAADRSGCHWMPGYRTILRCLDGGFQLRVIVSLAEQTRRRSIAEESAQEGIAMREARAAIERARRMPGAQHQPASIRRPTYAELSGEEREWLDRVRAIAAGIADDASDQAPTKAEAFIERRIAEVVAEMDVAPAFGRAIAGCLQDKVREARRSRR